MWKLRRGSNLKSRLLHPVDEYWDRRLRVSTFGYFPAMGRPDEADFRVHHTPMPYSVCFRILRHVGLRPDDVVVDLGCGLGRAVFVGSSLEARRSIGVDIVPQLVSQAQENAKRARPEGRDIKFHCMSAEDYVMTDATILVMFDPFGAGTIAAVVRSLEREMSNRPRDLRVAYVNPVHADVLDASELLTRIDHWPERPRSLSRYGRYAITFLRARNV